MGENAKTDNYARGLNLIKLFNNFQIISFFPSTTLEFVFQLCRKGL